MAGPLDIHDIAPIHPGHTPHERVLSHILGLSSFHGKCCKSRVDEGEGELCVIPGLAVKGSDGRLSIHPVTRVPINQSKVPLADKQIQSLTF